MELVEIILDLVALQFILNNQFRKNNCQLKPQILLRVFKIKAQNYVDQIVLRYLAHIFENDIKKAGVPVKTIEDNFNQIKIT